MNRLSNEKSPYLLQHKTNPVDWYPWHNDAFTQAKHDNKPIFLSIGYATCHWCHVMERESFEDEEVAALMNRDFVSIKVDREERPDIDSVYMAVCQMMGGSCGWPLNVLLTPDRKPFFVATYIPKWSRAGRLGMMDLLPRVAQLWRTERQKVTESSDEITRSLLQAVRTTPLVGDIDPTWLDTAYRQLADRFDEDRGGFGSAPKFPTPHNLIFLLRYWNRTKEGAARNMVTTTLEAMRNGGIFDHVGFGFHRYATDAHWLVPHFEKMLYDQALLIMAYTEAFQATGSTAFQTVVREISAYVQRDLRSPEGAFYSAEDADSEGEEGRFYVWDTDEIERVLGEDAAWFKDVFGLQDDGNYVDEASGEPTGLNIPYRRKPLVEAADRMNLAVADLDDRVNGCREMLFAHRERRPRPLLDDKILTDWNGLMIAALAGAGTALESTRLTDAAIKASDFILGTMRDDHGRLLHRYRDESAGISGMLSDYANLVWGQIALYDATFEARHLQAAVNLTDEATALFWDDDAGAFFQTAHDAESLIVRQAEFEDGAVPSGNAVCAMNLIRLARLTGSPAYEAMAGRVIKSIGDRLTRYPAAFTAMLLAVDAWSGSSREIVLVGKDRDPTLAAMLQTTRSRYAPHDHVLVKSTTSSAGRMLEEVSPFVRGYAAVDGRATAYVCTNNVCRQPVTELAALTAALDEN